jgi:hypothetical protein
MFGGGGGGLDAGAKRQVTGKQSYHYYQLTYTPTDKKAI